MGKRHLIRICIDCGHWLDDCQYGGCPDCDIEDVEGCELCLETQESTDEEEEKE